MGAHLGRAQPELKYWLGTPRRAADFAGHAQRLSLVTLVSGVLGPWACPCSTAQRPKNFAILAAVFTSINWARAAAEKFRDFGCTSSVITSTSIVVVVTRSSSSARKILVILAAVGTAQP
ncbi:hypothetical protein B0H11DRAFT_1939123 [Mycena galericulata]|nr:hypothetical protein B0H11DRAFT_1939123 [Mycena galericulata]